jgi:hypothetical protein
MMAEQLAGRNALYGILDDPASYRTQLANALYSPVTPDSRDGRTPQSYGILSNPAPRAADWAVRSGAADAISPTMGAFGMGSALGTTSNALMQQDWAGAAEAGLPLAMAMVPGLKVKGARPEPNALMPKAEAMGSPIASGRGSSSVGGGAGTNLSVFDVADQVAKLIGAGESRHHPTSFGNSSYVGSVRISDHPIGSGRASTGEISFSHLDGPEAIAQKIIQGREKQISDLLAAPPPERKAWMNARDWREEQQRYESRRPGWLTPEEWSARKNEYAATRDGQE